MNLFSLLAIFALHALSFVHSDAAMPQTTSSRCAVKSQPGPYTYDSIKGRGPHKWKEVEGDEMCGDGKSQSPVDFPPNVTYRPLSEGPEINMIGAMYNFSAGIETWGLDCSIPGQCGTMTFNDTLYTLFQVHFHTPSEHSLNGKKYAMESHFEHINAEKTQIVVVATMYDIQDNETYEGVVKARNNLEYGMNPLVSQVMANVMQDKPQFMVNPGAVINNKKGICTVSGSLTTPPCTEIVTFVMQLNVQIISKEQENDFRISVGGGLDGNARPIQPLKGREITCFV